METTETARTRRVNHQERDMSIDSIEKVEPLASIYIVARSARVGELYLTAIRCLLIAGSAVESVV